MKENVQPVGGVGSPTQSPFGADHDVGNALRSSKALIEAIQAGEYRSPGDFADVLSNFDRLRI